MVMMFRSKSLVQARREEARDPGEALRVVQVVEIVVANVVDEDDRVVAVTVRIRHNAVHRIAGVGGDEMAAVPVRCNG